MPLDHAPVIMDDHFLPATLLEALIPSLPASGYYIPNFISKTEEAYFLQKVSHPGYNPRFFHNQPLTCPDQRCAPSHMEESLPSPSPSPPIAPLANKHTPRCAPSHLAFRPGNPTSTVYTRRCERQHLPCFAARRTKSLLD